MGSNLQYPPPPGLIELSFPLKPVSLQAKAESKESLRAAIRTDITNAEYYLSGEVEVEVIWHLHEKERYQGVHSPDIDNILKPIIDALSGVDGILVNDCQVQSVRCPWIDWTKNDQELDVTLRFQPDDWIRKENLVWVEVSNKLCMPLYSSIKSEAIKMMLVGWQRMFERRTEISNITGSWEDGQKAMPVQQPFHRARLKGFHVVKIKNLLHELEVNS